MITRNNSSNSKIHIRIATEEDVNFIYELALIASSDDTIPEIFKNAGQDLIDSLREEKFDQCIILAYNDEQLIGLINYTEEENYITLESLYVRKDFRRQGIATAIVAEIDNLIAPTKKLRVKAVTEGGVKFWLNNGFNIRFWELERTN